MNITQVRIAILIIRSVDWALLIALIVFLIVAIKNEYSANITATVGIIGLIIVNRVGNWAVTKLAALRRMLDRLEHPPRI
jgi:hypothetical protein